MGAEMSGPRVSDPEARANLPPRITGTESRATIILKACEDVLISFQIRRKKNEDNPVQISFVFIFLVIKHNFKQFLWRKDLWMSWCGPSHSSVTFIGTALLLFPSCWENFSSRKERCLFIWNGDINPHLRPSSLCAIKRHSAKNFRSEHLPTLSCKYRVPVLQSF